MSEPKPEAKSLQEMFGAEIEHARRSILDFFSQSNLLIAFKGLTSGCSFRTGLYATLGGNHFVITAGHQLDGLHLDDFTYQSRPAVWRDSNDPGGGRPSDPRLPTPDCHVLDREVVPDPQDLLVMRIKPLPDKGGKVVPYSLDQSPAASVPFGCKTVALGFPGDLRDDKVNDPYTFKPLGLWSHVVEEPPGLTGFNPEYHFMTRYKLIEGDPMFGNSTRGMSGAPVFIVPPQEQVIAIPSALLIGIQHAEYLDRNLLKATRIEHVIPVVRKVLARAMTPSR